MKILLTNDDGINAPGIQTLCRELMEIGMVTVIAPDSEKSATGQAITVHNPIRVDKHVIYGIDVEAWRVGGTPTDCVKLALEAILTEKPDIVVSGINHGPNLGTDVLYSGTVSAAMEAALVDIPAVAISLDSWRVSDFAPAAKFARKFITVMAENTPIPYSVININIPDLPEEEIKAPLITKLGVRNYENTFQKRVDPRGRTYYWMGGSIAETENMPGTDIAAIKAGHISITPVYFDMTHHTAIDILKKWTL